MRLMTGIGPVVLDERSTARKYAPDRPSGSSVQRGVLRFLFAWGGCVCV